MAVSGSCSVDPKPILDALMHEREDTYAYNHIMEALRGIIGGRAAAERVIEERRKAEITAEGEAAAERFREIQEAAAKLWRAGPLFESAFASVFAALEHENANIRAEASKALAASPRATQELVVIYQQNHQSDPRKSVLAGRVLGRRFDAGRRQMIHAQASALMFGINVAFTPCVCGHCGKLNVGIPVPERGLSSPFYGQKDGEACAYSLPVLCDHCGKEFCIAWDVPINRT